MKFKRNVPAFVLALLLVFVGFGYVFVSNDNTELEAEVSYLNEEIEHLNEVVDATQQTADNWQEKYNDASRELASLERQIRDQEVLDAQIDQFENYVSNSSNPAPTPEPQTSVTVYVTNSGAKYHRWGCQYLWNSSIPVSLQSALASGYTPCSRCNPPRG